MYAGRQEFTKENRDRAYGGCDGTKKRPKGDAAIPKIIQTGGGNGNDYIGRIGGTIRDHGDKTEIRKLFYQMTGEFLGENALVSGAAARQFAKKFVVPGHKNTSYPEQ